jgi:hypothetical protein
LNFEMEKANMLAENIKSFVAFVHKHYQENNIYLSNPDKLYRLKLLIEEFQFHIIADELLRINKFIYDEQYTGILLNDFRKGIHTIGEYIDHNDNDLYIFSARLYTLRSICSSFNDSIVPF